MVRAMELPRSVGRTSTRCRQVERSTPPQLPQPPVPSWAQLPSRHRRRLVAVLGEMVLRQRAAKEDGHEGT